MSVFSTKQTGDKGEDYTARYLKRHGYKILDRNYRKTCGEIDIIALKKKTICFVEVKTRHSNSLTQPYEAVDLRKQSKIIKTARAYLLENKLELTCRFDVSEVFVNKDTLKLDRINYIKGAFDAQNRSVFY